MDRIHSGSDSQWIELMGGAGVGKHNERTHNTFTQGGLRSPPAVGDELSRHETGHWPFLLTSIYSPISNY
jgi:hypothetical protein